MKKIFTLFFALFMMAFCAKAQYLLQEGFEDVASGAGVLPSGWIVIDADNDGNNWYVLNNSQSSSGGYIIHSGEGHATSASYNNGSPLTPDNWLISPAVTLTANATLTFWVAGQDPSYAAENYSVYISTTTSSNPTTADFTTQLMTGTATGTMTQQSVNLSSYTGQTVRIAFRHHNVTDMFRLNLDDVEIFAQPTGPTIAASPLNIDFGTVLVPGSSTANVTITTYNLTAGVTATATAPFEVSADGTTYGTTATIAQTGGTLYVKYTVANAGTNNGTITLSSTGATDVTISLTGTGLDCSNTPWPYNCSFDNDGIIQCWTTVDVASDGTGSNGEIVFDTQNGYAIYAYLSSAPANDWLISPTINVPTTGGIASFDYKVASSSFPEKYSVYVITAGQTYTNATQVVPTQTVNNTALETQYIDLSTYAGTSIQIGIKVESDADMYRLYITNFTADDDVAASFEITPTEINFGSVPAGNSYEARAILHTVNVNEAFTLTTTVPFSISLDGTTYATTATIPANSTLSVFDTIYVKYNPANAGTDNGTIQIASTTYSDTITLSGIAVDCSGGIASLPFTYTFDDRIVPPTCWGYNDPASFLVLNIDTATNDYGIAIGELDYLITPEIHTTSAMHFSFDYAHYLQTDASSEFRVGYSSTTDNLNSFTWIDNITVDGNGFTTYTTILPAGTKYVAFEVLDLGYYYFYSDYLFLDNITLTEASSSEIFTTTTSINFGSIPTNVSVVNSANIVGVGLTTDITATTTAPFEVSADNTTFGATATIPAAGGTLYVRYAPTTAGAHNGNVTLTSTGATSVQISLSGSAVDCSTNATLPYTENFEGEAFPPACWMINSINTTTWTSAVNENDGSTWAYCTYATTLQDEKLITNAINFPGNSEITMTFDFQASYTYIHNDDVEEQYNLLIYASTDNGNTFSTTPLYDMRNDQGEFSSWETIQATVDLSSLAGQNNVKLMFRYYGTYGAELWIDNINIFTGTGIAEIENNDVKVFPNPANNVINVNATSNISNVEVFTITGQKVGDFTANNTKATISTANLTTGLYLMKIHTDNGVINKKFSVVR